MKVQTNMAAAFTKAAFQAAVDYGPNASWVARQVADRLSHTETGVKHVDDVHVKCSNKTRVRISTQCRVFV